MVLAGFDAPVDAVELHPFGAVIRYGAPATGPGHPDAIVAAAGPLQSFLLATISGYLAPLPWFLPGRVEWFIHLNLLLACFNLLPVWPLDGGRMARAWLAPRVGDGQAVRCLAKAGLWVGLALLLAGMAASAAERRPAWTPVLLGLFLWQAARRDLAAGQQAILRSVSAKPLRGGVAAVAWLVARESAPAGEIMRRMRADRYHQVQVVDDAGKPRGQLSEEELVAALLSCGVDATAGRLLAHLRGGPGPGGD